MSIVKSVSLATVLAGAAWAAPAGVQPLRLCADPANMPFSSNDPQAEQSGAPGLYVEIGQAVAQALGRPMQTVWSLSYFGKRNIRTTLLEGQCDLAVGLPDVPDFMGPRVIFSKPILTLGYAIVVPKGHAAQGLDDLKGQRVAVQYGSPPQSLLATRDDITSVTVMDPEEGMRRLATGAADAAFLWGPSAGYINHTTLHDAYKVVRIDAPQMQWQAAIGFSNKQAGLRDQVDAVLASLQPRIRDLSVKYEVAMADSVTLTDGGAVRVAVNDTPAAAPAAEAHEKGDASEGREIFDGTCAHCHGPDAVVADRKINLRLLKHKYGDQMEDVFYTTVLNGRPSKGMPTWKDVFKHQDFVNILTYLNTVQDK